MIYGASLLLVYAIFIIVGVSIGTKEMIPLKLGRLFIISSSFVIGYFCSQKWKYTVDLCFGVGLLSLGMLNAYYLKLLGDNVTYTGWSGEIIGNENTTFIFVMLCFVHNSPKYCMFVLSPIYVIINHGPIQ